MPESRSYFDATCPRCAHAISWMGALLDKPACPGCGHQDDPVELARISALLEAQQEEMTRGITSLRNP